MRLMSLIGILLLLVLGLTSTRLVNSQAQTDEAVTLSTIKGAEDAIRTAYQNVVYAEEAGANSAGLLNDLNKAEYNLTNALIAYAHGNTTEALSLAEQAQYIGELVKTEAVELKTLARNAHLSRQLLTSMGSVIGIVIVILGGMIVWRRLRGNHSETFRITG